MKHILCKTLVLSLMIPSLALAHSGVGQHKDFIHGFGHPLGGADHMLAMITVGLWAAQIGGRALWVVPCTFVSVMVIGGVLGFSGVSVPFVEEGIAASIMILGILVARGFKFPLIYSSMIVGLFAIFHGHAHGIEIPGLTEMAPYAAGFALATAMLHLAGMSLGVFMQNINLQRLTRFAGTAIALSGIYAILST